MMPFPRGLFCRAIGVCLPLLLGLLAALANGSQQTGKVVRKWDRLPAHVHKSWGRTVCQGCLSQVLHSLGDGKPAELEARIDALVKQLGDDNFAAREQAQAELARLGLAAFDALFRAQAHDDVEIAKRAQYLVRSMQVGWIRENDPPEVKSVLRDYGNLPEADRQTRMDQLAALDDQLGTSALCRLVRFEMSLRLSKEAAIRVMKQPQPAEASAREQRAKAIRTAMGLSRRSAAQWLRTYAQTLRSPESAVAQWDRLVKQEHEVFNFFPEQSRREIVRDLMQFQANLLVQLDRRDQATAVMLRWVDFGDRSRTELLEALDWLVERRAWSVVEDVNVRHSKRFEDDAELLYLLAEAYQRQDKHERAEKTASRAASLGPDNAKEHVRVGSVLRDRGLHQWSEREYRHVIQKGPAGSIEYIEAHLYLAEMLHDLQRELPAAKVLQGLIDLMEKEPAVARLLQGRRNPKTLVSRMYYFYAQHYDAVGDRQKQEEYLTKAIEQDPTDADVLIAMYGLPEADDPWRDKTQELIRSATGRVRRRIDQFQALRRRSGGSGDGSERKLIETHLASACNEYAWLVGNTEGNVDEAIRMSRKSLELRPNLGGFLDTLAHCYYAKGDYENAVKCQLKAVQFEPYSAVIARKLKVFEEALKKSKQE